MAKPELGTKRQCESCKTKFFDFNRDPIICPKCGATFVEPKSKVADKAVAAAETKDTAETGDVAASDEKTISLEDAENERASGSVDVLSNDADFDENEEIAEPSDDDDDTFLEEDDDDDTDVSNILGGGIGTGDDDE